ncbi:hypothetical protein N9Y95_00590, partial [Candidatus Pelagibacter bacterium]|nr:hypothetical protein [Candidatus Pelagibacter bacterium]
LKQFKENGFFIKKLNISNQEFQSYKNDVLNIVKNSKRKNYNYRRIYYDYLFSNNWAAVEVPLNKTIADSSIWSFFSRIKIGNAVKKIAGFNKVYCKLIRLFCMSNFNYCGDWHQDCDQPFKRVQASIYFKDEKGFKIIKPSKQIELFENYANGNKNFFLSKPPLPFKIDKSFFNEIEGREGEICFFDPFYLHQGSSISSRLQFHMRFDGQIDQHESFVTNENIDFLYNDFYDFNYPLDKNNLCLPGDIRGNIKTRAINTVNYFIPILNLRKKIKFKKKYLNYNFVKPDFFSNTFWQ